MKKHRIDFTRINNDTNGNPRYVCHFLTFIVPQDDVESVNGWLPIDSKYNLALHRSRRFGGRKFHNKQYGGGIVFQSYNIDGLGDKIAAFMKTLKASRLVVK